jgi:hypothetical protein
MVSLVLVGRGDRVESFRPGAPAQA